MLRVVIEPGHGGKDPGAIGPNGLCERDVVTEVCHFLASRAGDGIEYVLKRRTAFSSLQKLFDWMTAFRPDVILSIHCNGGWPKHPYLCCLVWGADPQKERYTRSALLADDILAALRTYINGDSTKVMTAPIERADGKKASTPGVLRGRATRAAVLVELGFIGVPAMAASMATSEWQSRAACGVDAGLREWLKLKEGEKG